MENLKLTSVRLSKGSLADAARLGRELGFWRTSDVIRVAFWFGLKFMTPGVLHKLLHMMWEEEAKGKRFSTQEVLRTAGVIKEGEQGAGL